MTGIPHRLFRLIILVVLTASGLAVAQSAKPNVILIMADDLGYGDLSCNASKKMRTPVLDRLAAGGTRLTSFYSGGTVCTPSRMALLTGCYPSRLGWPGGVMGFKISPRNGLPARVRTMAEVFKGSGYRTALSGKWHIGEAPDMLPQKRGFDQTLCILSSNNQTKKVWKNDNLVMDPVDNQLLTEHFTREAIRIIRERADHPFFLYLPFTAPHFPAEAHPDWKGKSNNGEYGDVVEELDFRIGEILASLKETGQENNTVIVFLSDNGPEPSQRAFSSAGEHSGRKWSTLEGGTRVPCIVSWPGVIPTGQVNDKLIAAIDLFPTLTQACGLSRKPADAFIPMDGLNVWPSLASPDAGQPHARSELLYWEGWATPQAIRVGQWKLYFDEVKGLPGSELGPVLIDLATDPAEEHNLASKHPDKAKELRDLARQRLEAIRKSSIPLGGLKEDSAKPTLKPPRWL